MMMKPRKRMRKTIRPFYLYRSDDVSGVSGTGVVAIGVVLPSGRVILEWCSKWPTITVFHSVREIVQIHGHGGRTTVRWGVPMAEQATPLPLPAKPLPGWRRYLPFLRSAPAMAALPADSPRQLGRPWWKGLSDDDLVALFGSHDGLLPFFNRSRWQAGLRAWQAGRPDEASHS